MKEISRDYYGRDERAINKHSNRVYEHNSIEYTLDRNLSGVPPFFSLYYFPKKSRSGFAISKIIPVEGSEYWGDGLTWRQAIVLAKRRVKDLARQKF